MADNEDDNNSASKSAAATVENVDASGSPPQSETTQTAAEAGNDQEDASKTAEGGVDQGLAEFMHSESAVDVGALDATQEVIGQIVSGEVITDPNIITSYVQATAEAGVTAECTTVSGEVLNALAPTTTIIYVQPDGSFVESSGLSAEEQQQLIEQLTKQQLVHVAGTENAVKASTSPIVDVQQVIVSKAQVIAQAEPATTHTTTPKILQRPVTTQTTSYIALESSSLQLATAIQPQTVSVVQNASQQLQSVAKQVALQQAQNGAHTTTQKVAEPIQIQVQAPLKQDNKQRQTTPITILQPQNLSASQPLVKVSTVGTLSSPQIFHITPVPGQQQYFLQNPSDPPIQLLLQKPAPVVSTISVPISKVHVPAPATVKSPPAKPIVPTPKILVPSPKVSSPPAKVTIPSKVISAETKTATPAVEKNTQKVKNRQKKPPKIQTRSGRVSRPPKHKVKDYKFIKNEDLAESHQSDSDDYSEISVEDEDGEESKKKTSDVTLNLRDKAFKCDTCEKAYIGVAGLNRHYKLNPTHDKNPTPPQAEDLSKTRDEQPSGTEVTDTSQVKTLSTQKVQEIGKVEPRRPGRPRGPGRPGRPRRPGRPPKRGRPGRPPKYPRGMSLEQQAQRQRNRLKEFIKQYDDEDLMEIVLPRLARVMTVWEFVLMKVEKGYPSKQQFPSVYHEFEQLHSQVKKMALEYLHTSPASRPAIEVNNMGNAKMLPPAKRFKIENCNEETNGYQVNQNGIQKDESVDGSMLRKPQVVLTRLEDLTSVDLTSDDATQSTENTVPERTEEEPMETEVSSSDSDATKTVEDPEISKVLNSSVVVDIVDQMEQLEQALNTDSEFKNSQEAAQQEVQDSQTDALEDPEASQVVQQESPFIIQTAEGLVMQSAEELAAKGIVIVNGPDGTMMHIEAPEGVPLETVHALLGIETERKT
uniref:Zinc finger protein 839 n=1 Tax=Cyprinus carpio TaxID=7962 RepID=A0A8C1KEX8_CYPCA